LTLWTSDMQGEGEAEKGNDGTKLEVCWLFFQTNRTRMQSLMKRTSNIFVIAYTIQFIFLF
jgi:hypothetical protein